jgi:predicted metal-dependent HD superfamily phosphohydrolase
MEQWLRLLPGAPELGRNLLERWSQPHRHYHTVDHLAAVLAVVDRFADLAAEPDDVRLAAWFHDAVYDPRATDNEERSAVLAETELPRHGRPAANVARLVRLTAGHDVGSDDADGALLADADLAILAASPDVYDRYTVDVRREYAHVPDELFRIGRATVLRDLAALPTLYRTVPPRAGWERAARANLDRELRRLG